MTSLSSDQSLGGALSDGRHRLAMRVYFADTDAGGVVYHATYLRYFERARWEMIALCGVDLLVASQQDMGTYVVSEANLKYHRPARLGDVLTIVSTIEGIGASTCVVQQNVMRGGLLLVEGRIRLAFVGPDGRARRQPASWAAAFRTIMGAKTMGAKTEA